MLEAHSDQRLQVRGRRRRPEATWPSALDGDARGRGGSSRRPLWPRNVTTAVPSSRPASVAGGPRRRCARGDHGDAIGEALRLLHVVGRQQDRLLERAQAVDQRPERVAAPTGRSRSSARRGTAARDRRRSRARGRVAAAAPRTVSRRGRRACRRGRRARRPRRRDAAADRRRCRGRLPRGRSAAGRSRLPAGRCRSARGTRARAGRGRSPAPGRRRRCGAMPLEDLDDRRLAGAVRAE